MPIFFEDYNGDNEPEFLFNSGRELMEYRLGGAVPTPTPNPCFHSGVTLQMPDDNYLSGDPFYLNISICNSSSVRLNIHKVFVIFALYGNYWFLPTWTDSTSGIDYYSYTILEGEYSFTIIPEFLWPGTAEPTTGVKFMAALMNSSMTELVGDISIVNFGWE